MSQIITDPDAPVNDGLDRSQRLLVKRARAMGIKIGATTMPHLMEESMGGMSPAEVAHAYAGAIAGLCGAALHKLPAQVVAEILEATAIAIQQHPDAIRGAVQ